MIAFFFYALSNSYIANFLLSPLENPYKNVSLTEQNVDGVIVLGGGLVAGSPNLPLSNAAYKRALWGVMVAKSHDIPLIFSGAGLNKEYSEADAFKTSMKELETFLHVKIPETRKLTPHAFSILVENRSLDTYENAKFSKEIFIHSNIQKPKIYLVTSAFHMRRAIKLYKHFGFEVIPVPTDFRISEEKKTLWDYFPNIWALENSYLALHEYVGNLSLFLKKIY